MIVERNWRLPETLPVGSVVQQVRADDSENNVLEFGLEPLRNGNFGNVNVDEEKMPFRIDPQTGVVYLNQSLSGWGGDNFFIYVTVFDGQLTAKNEVYVNILRANSSNPSDYYNPRPPGFQSDTIKQLFPPFHLLPGVANKPNAEPQSPVHAGNSDTPKNPGGFTYTSGGNQQPGQGGSDEDSGQRPPSLPPMQPNGNRYPNKTVLFPLNTRPDYTPNNSNGVVGGGSPGGSRPNQIPDIKQSISDKDVAVESEDSGLMGQHAPLIIVASVFVLLVVAVTSVVLFRKRLCAISKSLKKKSKAEMAKKSNQSQLSNGSLSMNTLSLNTNLTDDSRNSMTMQNWNGPTAFNNRYVPWERDHQQMTSQFSNDSQSSQMTNSGGGGDDKDPWEYPRHRLKFFNILGEGAFGQVWRCEAGEIDGKDGISTVAVKTLKENASEPEKNDLVSELHVMKSLETHVNVVRLLGCCTDKEPLFVIMEYVNLGKLQSYLRNSRAEK